MLSNPEVSATDRNLTCFAYEDREVKRVSAPVPREPGGAGTQACDLPTVVPSGLESQCSGSNKGFITYQSGNLRKGAYRLHVSVS